MLKLRRCSKFKFLHFEAPTTMEFCADSLFDPATGLDQMVHSSRLAPGDGYG